LTHYRRLTLEHKANYVPYPFLLPGAEASG
jgi:hypothetical protein